ncbi:MAG TPA: PAS domain-containing protein, partial [Verrucomicrobiae bacterium]
MSKPLVQESHASPETTGGRRWRWRYALTVGIVALATALRWGLDSLFGPGVAFITFFPAVGIVAMIAGGRAGVLATILSAVAAEWLFLGSGYRLTHSALGDLVGLGLFVAAGVLISVTAGMLGRARKREWEAAEREKAAGKVREWEQRLNYALETSQIGAWELNLNDQTAHRSLQHDRIFGYSELLPRWTYDMFLEHVLPEDRAMVDRKFREAVEAGTDWSFECRVRRADQQVRWIWASGRHRSDAAGTRCGLAGIVQDITERKQAQEDLRKSEEQLRVAATAAEIGMWSWRPGTDQVVVSANWRQLFGVSPDAAVTFATWSNALHPDDREDVVRELNAASQEHREFSVEYRAVHSDGTIRWIIDRGRAWYDDQGRPAGMAG